MLTPSFEAVAIATGSSGQGSCLGHIPAGWKRWGAGRQGGGSPWEVSFLPTKVLLQEFLVFGAFVLKPDLDLGGQKRKELEVRSVWGRIPERKQFQTKGALAESPTALGVQLRLVCAPSPAVLLH